jgi:hypothetical protein
VKARAKRQAAKQQADDREHGGDGDE